MARRRRAARELPNMRGRGYTFPEGPGGRSPPTDDEIAGLAQRHGFPVTFDLAGRLTHCWEWWRGSMQMGPEPPAKAHKEFLAELADRAQALEDALERAGAIERRAIQATIAAHELDLEKLRRSVRRLRLGAMIGTKTIARSPPGAHGDAPLAQLIFQLLRLYVGAFGPEAPRITKGAAASNGQIYSGRFFDLVDDVLRLPSFDVQKSNLALGKAIERVIRLVKRRGIELTSSPE
jgi:hypothetical protein